MCAGGRGTDKKVGGLEWGNGGEGRCLKDGVGGQVGWPALGWLNAGGGSGLSGPLTPPCALAAG